MSKSHLIQRRKQENMKVNITLFLEKRQWRLLGLIRYEVKQQKEVLP